MRNLAFTVLISILICRPVYAGNEIVEIYNGLSTSYSLALADGDYAEAANFANEQLGMDPSDSEAFMRLTLAVRLMKDRSRAKELLEHGLKMAAYGRPADARMKGLAKALLEDTLRVTASKD